MKATVKEKYCRKTVRLQGYDYGIDGAYFITICSDRKQLIFSEIVGAEIKLSPIGKIIDEEMKRTKMLRDYATIVEWIIMPNHVHFVIFIHKDSDEPEHLSPQGSYLYFPEDYRNRFGPQRKNLASIVRGIKSVITTRVKKADLANVVWQPSYYEHIVRNESELRKIILYIQENPYRWEMDENYPENM